MTPCGGVVPVEDLKQLPPPEVAVRYYTEGDLYLFGERWVGWEGMEALGGWADGLKRGGGVWVQTSSKHRTRTWCGDLR